jgi:hypothetical protein
MMTWRGTVCAVSVLIRDIEYDLFTGPCFCSGEAMCLSPVDPGLTLQLTVQDLWGFVTSDLHNRLRRKVPCPGHLQFSTRSRIANWISKYCPPASLIFRFIETANKCWTNIPPWTVGDNFHFWAGRCRIDGAIQPPLSRKNPATSLF